MRLLSTFLVFIALSVSFGQLDYEQSVINELCSDKYSGRGYVNQGDSLAAEYIKKQFQEIGLKPSWEVGSYFQNFRFPVNTFPGTMSIKVDSTELIPGKDYIVAPNSPSRHRTYNVHQVNPKIFLKQKKLTNYYKKVSKNDVLVIDSKLYETPGEKRTALRIAQQAQFFVPIIWIQEEKFTWGVSYVKEKNPLIYVQDSAFDRSAKTVRIDIDTKFIKYHEARNVIGEIKGHSDSTIIICGHYDHLGKMGSETTFPGANDNASGIAMLLSLAKHFVKTTPKYTLRFIAFAGEEVGLIGSSHYVVHSGADLSRLKFVLNLDILGSADDGITVVNGKVFVQEYELIDSINKEKQYIPSIKSRGKAANSDHYFFTEKGKRAFFIYTRGSCKNYHDINDTAENLPMVNYAELRLLFIDFVEGL